MNEFTTVCFAAAKDQHVFVAPSLSVYKRQSFQTQEKRNGLILSTSSPLN